MIQNVPWWSLQSGSCGYSKPHQTGQTLETWNRVRMATVSNNTEMRLIRDALEGAVGPADAAKLLFTALDEADAEMDADPMDFVRGPLMRILSARLAPEKATELLTLLKETLDPIGGITIEEVGFEDSTTMTRSAHAPSSGPLKVLVLSRSNRLVKQLEVALGPESIGAVTAKDETALSRLEGVLTPDVVIIDGQSAADVVPAALAKSLGTDDGRLILIWCSDQPAGSAVKNALEAHGVDAVAIPRGAGVDPLIDYLRAQMSMD